MPEQDTFIKCKSKIYNKSKEIKTASQLTAQISKTCPGN